MHVKLILIMLCLACACTSCSNVQNKLIKLEEQQFEEDGLTEQEKELYVYLFENSGISLGRGWDYTGDLLLQECVDNSSNDLYVSLFHKTLQSDNAYIRLFTNTALFMMRNDADERLSNIIAELENEDPRVGAMAGFVLLDYMTSEYTSSIVININEGTSSRPQINRDNDEQYVGIILNAIVNMDDINIKNILILSLEDFAHIDLVFNTMIDLTTTERTEIAGAALDVLATISANSNKVEIPILQEVAVEHLLDDNYNNRINAIRILSKIPNIRNGNMEIIKQAYDMEQNAEVLGCYEDLLMSIIGI